MKPIILDVDTGIDDAIGILLACASPEIEVLGITTVSGNIDLESATRNTLRVLKLIEREIPVYAGAKKPLVREPRYATEIHGASGLAGQLEDIEVQHKQSKHAVDYLIQTLQARPGEVTVVMTGPETNFALALRKEPRVAQWVKEVVVMGGAADIRGNESPVAEFNIAIDPEAAELVFQSEAKVTMVGLDVTTKALLTQEDAHRITDAKIRDFVAGATYDYMMRFNAKKGIQACSMHDPLAVCMTIKPDFVQTEHHFVGVETNSVYCDGMTVCDFDKRWNRPANVHVATALDARAFIDFLVERLSTLES